MSALGMGGPSPSSIPLPQGQGPGGGGGQPGPDSPAVEAAIHDAIDSLGKALDGENDAVDKATISKWIADMHKFLGDQQNLVDTVMGGGPGTKLIRKATGTPPPKGPGY